jgi:hypothetical protein
MQHYTIQSYKTKMPIFEGRFRSLCACLEAAVEENINLGHANLRNKNLTNACLDNALMPGADFTHANLTGANLSESVLRGAKFSGATLYNTCLACSDLRGAVFEDASFGATDITDSNLSQCSFSTLSCFSLDFSQVRTMQGCTFKNPDGSTSIMSRPPVVITGLGSMPLIFMDNHIKLGHDVTGYENGPAFLRQRLRIGQNTSRAAHYYSHG